MYFLLGDARERFHYLSHALGAILVFVGVKMGVSHWYHMPTAVSLAVILAILAAAIALSVRKQRLNPVPAPPAPSDGESSGSRSASGSDR
jgi:tellurite resistance protein TerC